MGAAKLSCERQMLMICVPRPPAPAPALGAAKHSERTLSNWIDSSLSGAD